MAAPDYRIARSTTIRLTGTTILAGALKDILQDVPRESQIRIDYTDFSGSPDPREHSYVTLTVTSP